MRLTIIALATALTAVFSPGVVFAQSLRTWVSGTGDDAFPCSRTAPCKTFASAISKTAPNGEINVVDPGAFGAVTITKSISIVAEGQTAGILAASTNGIIINSPTATVNLRGLDLAGAVTGFSAIKVLAAASVSIEKCRISDFRTDSGSISAAIDVENSGSVEVSVRDTTIWNNIRGISVLPVAGATAKVVIDNVLVQENTQGVRVGTGGTAFLNRSVVTQGNTGILLQGTGVVNTFSNNAIRGNTTDVSGGALTPVGLQ